MGSFFRLVFTSTELGMLDGVDFSFTTSGNRKKIDRTCINFSTKIPGCNEGMVAIDGNEKLTRAMCCTKI